jgi:fluoride exporter
MTSVFLVAAGGGLGAALRYLFGMGAARLMPNFEVLATFGVNTLGSGLMGVLMGWLLSRAVPGENGWYLFLGTGLLGGFTTFSAFSKDIVHLLNDGALVRAAAYAGGSVVLSCAAFMLMFALAKKVFA